MSFTLYSSTPICYYFSLKQDKNAELPVTLLTMITIIIRYGNHESNITLVCILDACVNLQIIFGNKRSRKLKGQLRMDNPEKLPTLGTQDTGRRQQQQKPQHRKLKRSATRTHKKPG